MRVWLVNQFALPPSQPGGTRHHALARELIRRGHEVTIIASSFNHAARMQLNCTEGRQYTLDKFDGVPFLLLRVPSYDRALSRLWNMFVFAFKLWIGVGIRRLQQPEIIIGSSVTLLAAFSAERLAKRFNVPFVLEIRDLWPQTLIDLGMKAWHPAVLFFGVIEKYLYRHADKIVTLLPNGIEHMEPKGARPSDVTWIPNGVDFDRAPRPYPPTPSNRFTVLYTGSHGLSDALDSVLDAAAILNKTAPGRFLFRIVGNGPTKAALRNRATAERITNIVFEEPVPKLQVFSLLLEADTFIITAKKTDLYRYGISPNKLHEYMAAGRPTIFAGNSFNNPIAEARAGITVMPEDATAIAGAVETLAAMSASERWNMGLRAREYVQEHHNFVLLGQRLEQVLLSALPSTAGSLDEADHVDAGQITR
jgi:glycosyltransferase involved in cell wall biosynthesis